MGSSSWSSFGVVAFAGRNCCANSLVRVGRHRRDALAAPRERAGRAEGGRPASQPTVGVCNALFGWCLQCAAATRPARAPPGPRQRKHTGRATVASAVVVVAGDRWRPENGRGRGPSSRSHELVSFLSRAGAGGRPPIGRAECAGPIKDGVLRVERDNGGALVAPANWDRRRAVPPPLLPLPPRPPRDLFLASP
jgi:hypothetical protein